MCVCVCVCVGGGGWGGVFDKRSGDKKYRQLMKKVLNMGIAVSRKTAHKRSR